MIFRKSIKYKKGYTKRIGKDRC